ncbi:MAG: Ig-like domain-containing protein, partial [Candidatus Cloacimonetes bacterium]|nr:Ig-like domain-containing protein [Candidatus Cloacimonadota bacterium]
MKKTNLIYSVLLVLTILVFLSCEKKTTEPDNTPPTVTITQPANGETLTEPVTIKVDAADNESVKKVEFIIDGDKVGEDTNEPYEYGWNVYYWADGQEHTILAKAHDSSGNIGQSSVVQVTVFLFVNSFTKTFGGSDSDRGSSVSQTDDGGYIIAGDTYSYDVGWGDVWLIKTDGLGNEEWNNTFGGNNEDSGSSVSQTDDGGYIIIGGKCDPDILDDIPDVWLIKTDGLGNEEWNKTFGGSDSDCGFSGTQTDDGGYIITGYTESYGAGNNDVWL